MHKSIIWNLLSDLNKKSGITEVVINSPREIFVEKMQKFVPITSHLTEKDLLTFVEEVKLELGIDGNSSSSQKIFDGMLPDGSRINIILPPLTTQFPAITIRKYLKIAQSFDSNPHIFGLNEKWTSFLKALVKCKFNIVISGGTGIGKTSFLNLVLNEISMEERLVTIEDTLELDIKRPNIVRLKSGDLNFSDQSVYQKLIKNTLRMKPDRIILGECRGGEFYDFLVAMNTGHNGTFTTIHANSSYEAIIRMENLFLLSGIEVPLFVVRKQLSMGINFIIHLGKNHEGQRVIDEILEIDGMENQTILTSVFAKYSREKNKLEFTGVVPKRAEKMIQLGLLDKQFFYNF